MYKLSEGIWQIVNLLTLKECDSLITKAEALGFRMARMKSQGRNNSEAFFQCSETIKKLSFRLKYALKDNADGFEFVSLKPVIEFYRYQAGEFVTAHSDAPQEIEHNVWSTLTLLIYLSEDIEGGATFFPESGIQIHPQVGTGVLFKHSLLHEGSQVLRGTKYIIRSDIATSGCFN
ncbi:2OG-Fe(II) oxygenase [Aetokthonos hydrillicola Thurmond2011]|jgi:hypothetical protein|uniref:2OG-Fe(II) oxygenase n=1 Tax=Aetokthonos hydrillicola Thurmond2011 TaxID=2712845 RepID=A0AAP5IE11_9CYAN|nr:2OG-Fe(II) oxygenase [Aetokthonos hydrillicola]MBO3459733.1 hypothetical protein [Aetokthonos hydrillicola CCALA 1050]MBW4585165.1 2OG-Fe(II) oxygenase [Aetokthonos hydrillicola CCALA 1050]MDR9899504.1 2OG-Fe(II) oxygenase [Aetokthonos hydrillicola Thurmond2011]